MLMIFTSLIKYSRNYSSSHFGKRLTAAFVIAMIMKRFLLSHISGSDGIDDQRRDVDYIISHYSPKNATSDRVL